MKISINWLSRYVDLQDLSAEQIRDDLTMSTAEIEGIETFGQAMQGLVVGKVIERVKHPQADKLSLTKVDVGGPELLPIVCGAPNVAAGQRVAVIQPGQVLSDGSKIKKTKIRGEVSLGMIMSERELGLSEEHDGIMVLDTQAKPGTALLEVLPILDQVLEIDNKSINHRPDLWGHYGIARELAAIYGRPLQPLLTDQVWPQTGRSLPVKIDDLKVCSRYLGLVIENVQTMPSPDWMRYLLQAVEQRPINLLVDLTNFIMLELGQPMHAFDLRHIQADGIHVRNARPGESMATLDGQQQKLQEQDLLITSGDHPVALAGIMGGEGSMVADDTTELFLESANFHAATIRRTSTRLGLRTDSSTRFEKTLDPAQAELAVHRFVQLLQESCPKAKVAGPLQDPSAWQFEPRSVLLRRKRLDLKLGHPVPEAQVRQIFERLQFGVAEHPEGLQLQVPSFRASKDIHIEDDLIEEVGRMFRYDNIPEVPLTATVEVPQREEELELSRKLVEVTALELGCHEVYNYSFVPDNLLQAVLAESHEYSVVKNPVAPEICKMRRHVLPSLLSVVAANLRLAPEVRMFEHGKGYQPETRDEHNLPFEVRELAIVQTHKDQDLYPQLRSMIESLLRRVGYPITMQAAEAIENQPWRHPSHGVQITRAGLDLGFLGHLHPQVCRNLDLPLHTSVCNLDIRQILASGREEKKFAPIPRFPGQPVDVALLVPLDCQVGEVQAFLQRVGKKLVRSVSLFEVYRGEGLPEGRKSLNFTVTLGAKDRTLNAQDEEKYLNKVRQQASEVQAELRG